MFHISVESNRSVSAVKCEAHIGEVCPPLLLEYETMQMRFSDIQTALKAIGTTKNDFPQIDKVMKISLVDWRSLVGVWPVLLVIQCPDEACNVNQPVSE